MLCKDLQFPYDPGLDELLRAKIERTAGAEMGRVVRACSVYFQPVDVAEGYYRVHRRQCESGESSEPQRAL